MSKLQENLEHSRTAYKFALNSLPADKANFPVQCNGFQFEKFSQVNSIVIELGWAFFCRYEACFESYMKSKGINLSKKLSLVEWFDEQKIKIHLSDREGLSLYRKIRNKLHHEDGAALNGAEDEEIHLLPEHMENFYNLFVLCGDEIEKWANKPIKTIGLLQEPGSAELCGQVRIQFIEPPDT